MPFFVACSLSLVEPFFGLLCFVAHAVFPLCNGVLHPPIFCRHRIFIFAISCYHQEGGHQSSPRLPFVLVCVAAAAYCHALDICTILAHGVASCVPANLRLDFVDFVDFVDFMDFVYCL